MSSLLSQLPNMNDLIGHAVFDGLGRGRVKKAAREILDELREAVLSGEVGGEVGELPGIDECARMAFERIDGDVPSLCGLINATGVVLHTNLGRAPLGMEMYCAASEVFAGYCNLEFDLDTGLRGSRYTHVESLICELTGCEAAMAVNNNAAAMVLILSALAGGKKVAVSRGELVEIGGSLRIPEIIAHSGAVLIEVGSTNKTRLRDYQDAVENRGAEALLKVHTSNFEIVGFTESVSIAELSSYGKSAGLPVIYDMGSCFLVEPGRFGFRAGETAMSGVAAGADVICFSGDKLMGCVQCGVIAGRAEYIDTIKRHPLTRAMRPDKLTLCVLEAALRLYRYPDEAVRQIPVLAMLFAEPDELKTRAGRLAGRLSKVLAGWSVDVCETSDEAGGGSLPNIRLPGWAVAIKPSGMSVNELESALRLGRPPVIIRIADDTALISPRTLLPQDEDKLVEAFAYLSKEGSNRTAGNAKRQQMTTHNGSPNSAAGNAKRQQMTTQKGSSNSAAENAKRRVF